MQAPLKFILAAALVAAVSGPAEAQRRRTVKIGIVTDGSSDVATTLTTAIQKQTKDLGASTFDIRFPTDKIVAGQFSVKKIEQGLDTLLADPEVSLIYALGPVASHVAGQRKRLAKPVIAPLIIDRKLQGLPFSKGRSGRKRFSYLDWPWSIERDLAVFAEVAAPKRIVFLASEYLVSAIPGLADTATKTAKAAGIELLVVGVTSSVEKTLAALPAGIDGVYIAPLPQMKSADFDALLAALAKRRLATFALNGELAVRRGALVGRRPKEALGRIARRVALHTLRILGGQDASTLRVALTLPERVMINMKTARAIGLAPQWKILTEAELINVERDDIKRKLSLTTVIKEALAGNVNIKALEQTVAAGRASVRRARAPLLPKLDVSASGRLIDRDRARASFGNAPERLFNADLSAQQVLWSEGAWAGYTAEKHLQRRRNQQLVQTKWDIAAQVGVAYLNVLRSKTAERIQRDNLKVTRSNLELARIRVDAGSSSRADVYRWEVQIANDRRSAINASAQRNLAEAEVQRILHRPPEERFATVDEKLPGTADRPLHNFIGDPRSFRLFRQFMVKDAIARSPEVAQLDAAIAAQQRIHKSAKRTLYSPALALSAGATQRLHRGGVGSTQPMGSGANGLEWFIGLNVSLPLYSGGERFAEIDRNGAEVARLVREREFVQDQIAQRAISNLHLAGASFAGIELTKQAATAAQKNYELVAKAYGEGAARVVDLLDAQNAWVTSEQVAANAVYDFLIDWVNVQRSVGRFEMLMPLDERKRLADRAIAYIKAHTPAIE